MCWDNVIDVWQGHDVVGDIGVCSTRYVDKIESCFHFCGHSSGEARQFFADIFFERGAAPPPHFLDFSVRISGQREGIGSATPQGVGIDALDWDSLVCWIVQDVGGCFHTFADVGIHNIELGACYVESRQIRRCGPCISADVGKLTAQGSHGAVVRFAVCFLMDAYSLPPIFLVV